MILSMNFSLITLGFYTLQGFMKLALQWMQQYFSAKYFLVQLELGEGVPNVARHFQSSFLKFISFHNSLVVLSCCLADSLP